MQSLMFSLMLSTTSQAEIFTSPWAEGAYLDALRMEAELSNERSDYVKLANEAYSYALLNAADQKRNSSPTDSILKDSISGSWPQVVITKMNRYYCGYEIADLVHHSTVWIPAIRGLTQFLSQHYKTLSPWEKKAITKTVAVAMNGLNFFASRDLRSQGLNSAAFLFRVPAGCPKNTDLNGKIAPLNYNTAAGHLALELKLFFSLPTKVISAASPSLANNSNIYLENMATLVQKVKDFTLSQIQKDSHMASIWKYIPMGRSEDNTHAYITVNWLVRLRQFKLIPAAAIYGLLNAFDRQFSRGPHSTYAYLDTSKTARRGTLYATSGLLLWSEIISYDCSLIPKFEALLNTPVRDEDNGGHNAAPSLNNSYRVLKINYSKQKPCHHDS